MSADEAGLLALVRQFSTPGGIPSHVSVPTPGSIHEGGELGYALMHAFGAAFDNPDLLVACVIGDGEAETAPLEGSWKGIRFLDPARDGAVLPILHLNEHKIAGPTVLGRVPEEDLLTLLRGHGYAPRVVAGDDPRRVHQDVAVALDAAYAEIRAIQEHARDGAGDGAGTPRWPAIVLRTPKGWTGPREVDGKRWRPTATCGWARCRGPTAGACSCRSTCPLPRPTHWRWCGRPPSALSRRANSGRCCAMSTPATPALPTSACSAPTRRTPTGWARCSRSRTGCCVTRAPGTSTSRRAGVSWRSSPSTTARAGWRATC